MIIAGYFEDDASDELTNDPVVDQHIKICHFKKNK